MGHFPVRSLLSWDSSYTEAVFAGDKLQKDIREWLSPPDPMKNHKIARESQHCGTATWWVQGYNFAEWKSSGPSSLLWVHGKRQCFFRTYMVFRETQEYDLCSGLREECSLVRVFYVRSI